MGSSIETKCVLCGSTGNATLTIPQKGAVCLNCIKNLNTTVEELVNLTVKSGSVRVDTPALPAPVAVQVLSPAPVSAIPAPQHQHKSAQFFRRLAYVNS